MFQKLKLKKTVVYLSEQELNMLLLQNIELYKIGLARGKAFKRSQVKKQQVEAKWSEHDGQSLNFIQ